MSAAHDFLRVFAADAPVDCSVITTNLAHVMISDYYRLYAANLPKPLRRSFLGLGSRVKDQGQGQGSGVVDHAHGPNSRAWLVRNEVDSTRGTTFIIWLTSRLPEGQTDGRHCSYVSAFKVARGVRG